MSELISTRPFHRSIAWPDPTPEMLDDPIICRAQLSTAPQSRQRWINTVSKQLDIGSTNPRLQCAACGRWMRLHGRRLELIDGEPTSVSFQRFYGGCSVTNGDHPFGGDVCSVCCPTKCREKLAALSTAKSGGE